jgi:hypothetical protein
LLDPGGPGYQVNIDDLHFGAQAPGDVNNDEAVNVADVVDLLLAWGPCPPGELCFADLDDDGSVTVGDLVAVLLNWE